MEIAARDLGPGNQFDQVVRRFMYQLAELLPWLMGPHGPHVRPLWHRTAELFGVMAAKRGLAAGEVIEEFQILRELLIRMLLEHPLAEGALSLRDILRLNRIVDSGVVHASVGHTDAMFFQFFGPQENQVSQTPEEIVREAERQLVLVAQELSQVVDVTPAEPVRDVLGN